MLGAKLAAPKLELALLLLVFNGVEEGLIVGGPDDGAYSLNFAGEGFAGFEIFDVQGVLAEAGCVGCVGQPAAVVGDVGCADGKKAWPSDSWLPSKITCSGVSLWRGFAGVNGVLFALFGAGEVPPGAIAVGDGDIGLLDVREHFLVKVIAEGG